ncbi:MAG: acyl-CoA thioesterase [Fimbriimonadaceae bacterium]
MQAKRVSDTHTTTAHVMTPNEANFLGKVFGGALMALIDLAAFACASKFAEKICVTASFDRVDFHDSIDVGEIVTLDAYVSYVGRTSVEVTIDVYAQNVTKHDQRKTNTARVTMVAIENGKPSEVPKLICETREDKLRYLEGSLRRSHRGEQKEHLDRLMADYKAASEENLDAAVKVQMEAAR